MLEWLSAMLVELSKAFLALLRFTIKPMVAEAAVRHSVLVECAL